MIVDDFNVLCAVTPSEADAPLIVDADTVLSFAVTFECFQPVAGRNAEIVEARRRRQHLEFPPSRALDAFEAFDRLIVGKSLSVLASEALDHSVYGIPKNGMRQVNRPDVD
jgi:hypothetical protein